MSIDKRYTTIYNNYATWCYGMNLSYLLSLQSALIDGSITGFDVSNFFQQNSDYVVSFKYFPFDINRMFVLNENSNLFIGKKEVTTFPNMNTILRPTATKPAILKWFTFQPVRVHDNFLDFAPYTKITIQAPFFEPINIDPQIAYDHTIDGYISVDIVTGHASLFIYLDNDILYDTRSCIIAIDVPFGKTNAEEQRRNNVLQGISALGSAIGLAVGVYSGNPLVTAGSVGLLSKNVTSAMANNVDHLTGYHGGTGNRDGLTIDKTIYMITEYPKDATQPSASLRGYPCKQTLQLSTLTGYCEVGSIHLEGFDTATSEEKSQIENLLKSGVIL